MNNMKRSDILKMFEDWYKGKMGDLADLINQNFEGIYKTLNSDKIDTDGCLKKFLISYEEEILVKVIVLQSIMYARGAGNFAKEAVNESNND